MANECKCRRVRGGEVGVGGVEEQVWRGQRRRGGEEGEREVRRGEGVGGLEEVKQRVEKLG